MCLDFHFYRTFCNLILCHLIIAKIYENVMASSNDTQSGTFGKLFYLNPEYVSVRFKFNNVSRFLGNLKKTLNYTQKIINTSSFMSSFIAKTIR